MPKFELYEIMDKKEYKNFLLENLPDDLYKSGREMTKRFEGFEDKVYLDKKGNATIGYGTNLEIPSNRDYFDPDVLTDIKPLEEKDASRVFDISYNQSIKDAISFVGKETFDKLDETRQEILIDMSYNLGLTKLNDFNRMRTALQKGDYNIAADEMIDSDWYTDVGDRSKELVGMMRPEIKFDNQQKESLSRERTPRFSLESIEEPKFQLEDVDDKPKTMGIGETYKRMGKTIYGATLKTAAKTAESLDFYANKISEATGLQKGGLFSYLSENWDYYGDELMKEGLTQGVVQKIYAGVGSLSWSLPMIMTTIKGMGAMGKHLGLGTYAAFEAGKEGKEEVAKEFTKGVLFQGTLRATSVLPMSIQVPTMSGLFAGSTWLEGGSTEDMISSGFLGAALSMMGKAPSWQEFLAPYRDAKFTKYKTLLDKTRNSSIEYLVKKGATREQAQSVMDSYLIYKSRQSANYKIPKKQLLNALKDIKAGKDIQLDPEYIGLLSDYHKQYYGRNYESKTTTKAPESISVIKGEKVPKTEIVGKKPVTPIVKPPDALSQQAKGKSLDEFVESQGKMFEDKLIKLGVYESAKGDPFSFSEFKPKSYVVGDFTDVLTPKIAEILKPIEGMKVSIERGDKPFIAAYSLTFDHIALNKWAIQELSPAKIENALIHESLHALRVKKGRIKSTIGKSISKEYEDIQEKAAEGGVEKIQKLKEQELTSIWEKVQEKPLEQEAKGKSLEVEAKQYKSADEFVESSGKTLYHGTDKDFKELDFSERKGQGIFGESNIKGQAIFLAEDKENAKFFSGFRGTGPPRVIDVKVSSNAKIFDFTEKDGKNFQKVWDELYSIDKEIAKDIDEVNMTMQQAMNYEPFIKNLKKAGYDGVRFVEPEGKGTSIGIINKDVIKTKSQLTSIWEKAQEKTPEVKPKVQPEKGPQVRLNLSFIR